MFESSLESSGGWAVNGQNGPTSPADEAFNLLHLRWSRRASRAQWRLTIYPVAKRTFDISFSILLLPALLLLSLGLLTFNLGFGRGKLFFVQERMGQNCRPIKTLKFRTMTESSSIRRGAFDPLDVERITPVGRLLRRSRLDELPQVINVLRGEMSLIGPRPDYFQHALIYLDAVPGYRERHTLLPGISGFAQVEVGYADQLSGIRAKVAADLFYVQNASFRFDLWIAWRTLLVMLGCKGL